jgi:hypothetical protein
LGLQLVGEQLAPVVSQQLFSVGTHRKTGWSLKTTSRPNWLSSWSRGTFPMIGLSAI